MEREEEGKVSLCDRRNKLFPNLSVFPFIPVIVYYHQVVFILEQGKKEPET